MTKQEKKIDLLVEKLGCTYEEALDICKYDAEVERGKNPLPLSKEAEQASKAVRIVMGDAKPKAKPNRVKKVNGDKVELMNLLTEKLESVNLINPEREAEFYYKGKKYKIVLSMPRK